MKCQHFHGDLVLFIREIGRFYTGCVSYKYILLHCTRTCCFTPDNNLNFNPLEETVRCCPRQDRGMVFVVILYYKSNAKYWWPISYKNWGNTLLSLSHFNTLVCVMLGRISQCQFWLIVVIKWGYHTWYGIQTWGTGGLFSSIACLKYFNKDE